jgi:hypothetical protein
MVLAVFLAPSSSGSAASTSLHVSPGSGTYGGQRVTWSGDIGSSGVQQIHLQRRGSPTAAWADVPASTFRTAADGSFSFDFPAPAMNGVYFRVVSARGATPAHRFDTVHQDAVLAVAPLLGSASELQLPSGTAVLGELFSFVVDTVRGAAGEAKPVLIGRRATLQRRTAEGWEDVASGTVGRDGKAGFGPFGPGAARQVAGVYRVVLGDWTQDGDRVGWIPSLPMRLRLVDTPLGAR